MTLLFGGFHGGRRLSAALVLAAVALLASAGLASAHEHRHVADEQYEMVVGFISEPAVQNQVNGMSVRVNIHDEDAPEDAPTVGVEGLQDTLEGEVIFGGQTMPVDLEAAFNDPGHYRAFFIPTGTGAYTFRVFGTIEGNAIDESFTGGPETFSEVTAIDTLYFPTISGSVESATAAANDAQDSADSAQTLAIVGLVVGLLGLIAGGVGLYMAMQARKPATAAAAATAEAD